MLSNSITILYFQHVARYDFYKFGSFYKTSITLAHSYIFGSFDENDLRKTSTKFQWFCTSK